MRLAIYRDGNFAEERDFPEVPSLPHKPALAFYTVETVKPDFDAATQIRFGPTVEEDHDAKVRRYVYTVRDKTAEELEADKEARIDRLDLVALRIAFNHENRIRALEGKQAISAAQFKAAVKALL